MLCSFDVFANDDCAVRDIPQYAESSWWNGREENLGSLGNVTKEQS